MKTITLLITCVCLHGQTSQDLIVLREIGVKESNMRRHAIGDGGRALGAYQMHVEAWMDANVQLMREGTSTCDRASWRDADVQDKMALAYLRVIRIRLSKRGYENPSTWMLMRCWNYGVEGATR